MKSTLSVFAIIVLLVSLSPKSVSAGEIWSSNPDEQHHYIRTTQMPNGRIRFELCDRGKTEGVAIGSPQGYTERELSRKANWVKTDAAFTALGDAALAAGAAAACVSGGTLLVMLLSEGANAAYASAWLGGAVAGTAGTTLVASASDALNPKLKWSTSNTLKAAASCKSRHEVSGSILRLQKRLDQALREIGRGSEPTASPEMMACHAARKDVPFRVAAPESSLRVPATIGIAF